MLKKIISFIGIIVIVEAILLGFAYADDMPVDITGSPYMARAMLNCAVEGFSEDECNLVKMAVSDIFEITLKEGKEARPKNINFPIESTGVDASIPRQEVL